MSRMLIKNIAIIGAGTMGAQIACLFASAGIAVELFDLPSIDIKNTVLKKMAKLEPSPIAHPLCLENIFSRDLTSEKDLEKLTEVDWVIEAIVEKIEIKKELFKKIENYLLNNIKNNSNFILATNTSGLSIETMASILPEEIKPRFFGIHFFNPPRYLPLVEIIPNVKTELRLLDWAENFLVRYLGKSVLRAKDTPGFIANRMGVFSLFITIFYAEKFNIPIEIVDELTGKLLGRPKSATFRTADIVGLDVISHVLKTLKEGLKNCPYAKIYELPVWIENLIQQIF